MTRVNKPNILIIEDEKKLLGLIGKRLENEGYAAVLEDNGKRGLKTALSSEYDCIILDIMLPSIDGFTILKKLRAKKIDIPVIVLTAKSEVTDRVSGLDYGADDYITKPFSFDELIARVRAVLRRKGDTNETVLKSGDLTLDLITRDVKRNGKPIELTVKEFAILEFFLRNRDKTITKSQIAEHVWNYDFDRQSNIIEVYIRYLRKKIDDNYTKKHIKTVRGIGYKLE